MDQFSKEFANLPMEAQKKLSDNIAPMIARYRREAVEASNKIQIPLSEESFTGVWANRADMNDSFKWIREMHENEWNQKA